MGTLAQTETGPGRKARQPHSHKQRQALGEKPGSHTPTNRDRPWTKSPAATLTCTQTRQGASRHLHKIKSHSHPLCTHVSHASPCKSIVSHVLTCNSRLRAKTRYDAAPTSPQPPTSFNIRGVDYRIVNEHQNLLLLFLFLTI